MLLHLPLRVTITSITYYKNAIGINASLLTNQVVNTAFPVANIYANRMQCLALIDTSCSRTIIYADQCLSWKKASVDIMTSRGISRLCCGIRMVTVSIEEGGSAKISVLLVCSRLLGFNLLLGTDAIKELGRIAVGLSGQI